MALVVLLQFLFSVISSLAFMFYFVAYRAVALLVFAVVQLLKFPRWVSASAVGFVADLLRLALKHAIGLLANVVTSVVRALIEAIASAATGAAQLAASGAAEVLEKMRESMEGTAVLVSGLVAQVVDGMWGRVEGNR